MEILTNPTITQEELVKEYGVSSRTIKRWMQKMDNISYVGCDSNGHWEINDEN
ncbi:MAG: ATP-dependent DNA helicase RecG [Firmicutes bacterium]|nr:ATP-dependent DNA helicase RecG [Bacillota bacterium]